MGDKNNLFSGWFTLPKYAKKEHLNVNSDHIHYKKTVGETNLKGIYANLGIKV